MNCQKGLLVDLARMRLHMVSVIVIGPIFLSVSTPPQEPGLLGTIVKDPAILAVGTNLTDIKV